MTEVHKCLINDRMFLGLKYSNSHRLANHKFIFNIERIILRVPYFSTIMGF